MFSKNSRVMDTFLGEAKFELQTLKDKPGVDMWTELKRRNVLQFQVMRCSCFVFILLSAAE